MKTKALIAVLLLAILPVACNESPTDPGDAPNFSTEESAPFVRNCYNGDILPGRLVTIDTRADVADFITDSNGIGNIQPLTYPDGFFDRQPWEVNFRYDSATGCPVSPCQGGTFPKQAGIARGLWAEHPRGGKYVRLELCLMP